jgi:hypothetical protein
MRIWRDGLSEFSEKEVHRITKATPVSRAGRTAPMIQAVGVCHGVNLLQPERCARAAVEFWRPMV